MKVFIVFLFVIAAVANAVPSLDSILSGGRSNNDGLLGGVGNTVQSLGNLDSDSSTTDARNGDSSSSGSITPRNRHDGLISGDDNMSSQHPVGDSLSLENSAMNDAKINPRDSFSSPSDGRSSRDQTHSQRDAASGPFQGPHRNTNSGFALGGNQGSSVPMQNRNGDSSPFKFDEPSRNGRKRRNNASRRNPSEHSNRDNQDQDDDHLSRALPIAPNHREHFTPDPFKRPPRDEDIESALGRGGPASLYNQDDEPFANFDAETDTNMPSGFDFFLTTQDGNSPFGHRGIDSDSDLSFFDNPGFAFGEDDDQNSASDLNGMQTSGRHGRGSLHGYQGRRDHSAESHSRRGHQFSFGGRGRGRRHRGNSATESE